MAAARVSPAAAAAVGVVVLSAAALQWLATLRVVARKVKKTVTVGAVVMIWVASPVLVLEGMKPQEVVTEMVIKRAFLGVMKPGEVVTEMHLKRAFLGVMRTVSAAEESMM